MTYEGTYSGTVKYPETDAMREERLSAAQPPRSIWKKKQATDALASALAAAADSATKRLTDIVEDDEENES